MRRIGCFLMLLCILPLTGCAYNQDLQDMGLISGISYDAAEEGQYLYTCQIERGDEVVTLEGKGDTMSIVGGETIRSTGVVAHRLNVNLVVISEEVARRGAQQILSALYTYEGSSGEEQIVIAKGSAKELLATGNTETAQQNLLEMLTHFGSSGAFANCTLQRMVSDTVSPMGAALVPVFEARDGRAEPVGMAVLKEYKMVDLLEEDEAKGALRVQGRQIGGRESIPLTGEIDAGVKLTQSDIQVTIEGSTIHMMLYCGFSPVDINSQDLVSSLDDKIETGVEEKIKSQAKAAFAKAQALDIDIMGLSKWFTSQTGEAPKSLKDYALITQAKAEVIHGVAGGGVE